MFLKWITGRFEDDDSTAYVTFREAHGLDTACLLSVITLSSKKCLRIGERERERVIYLLGRNLAYQRLHLDFPSEGQNLLTVIFVMQGSVIAGQVVYIDPWNHDSDSDEEHHYGHTVTLQVLGQKPPPKN